MPNLMVKRNVTLKMNKKNIKINNLVDPAGLANFRKIEINKKTEI